MVKTFLDFDKAVQKSLAVAQVTSLIEIVNIEKSLGRVISEDILCVKKIFLLLITLLWMVLQLKQVIQEKL